ncbi:rhamnogalacturonan acetylesterase [Brevundimonas sp. R86498]|uniref:rhamnogalacturonan acetylesterase n=1 Tax=Brevundimonas sp. R86498 TaxID=3093845 RepID=UPI0037C7D803
MVAVMVASLASPAGAQARRFDFTGAPAGPGWTDVGEHQAFDPALGFGFEADAGDPPPFSVTAPEGDYRVTVIPRDGQPLTVRAESRRLMVQDATGPQRFTVNVRNPDLDPVPANAPGGPRVRLNPRETGSRSWDDRLTLLFGDGVAQVEIEPVEARRIVLLGDSTVADQAGGDYASWGQMLPRFVGGEIAVANHAELGETLKSFLTSLRLDKALSQMRPDDLVLIQFGHNDSKTQWPQTHAGAATTFRSYLRVYIDEVRRRGARPVLVTSPHRRSFGPDRRIVNTHGDYPAAVHAVGAEQAVPVIDLNATSAVLYEALGPDRSRAAFADQGRDATHHNAYGAWLLAWAVADALAEIPDATGTVRSDTGRLDPTRPPPPDSIATAAANAPATPRPAGW